MNRNKISFLFLLAGLSLGCTTNHQNSCPVPKQAHGFGFSPLGFPKTYNDSTRFFEDMEHLKDSAVMWNGSWRDDAVDGSDAGEAPVAASLIQDSAIQYCFVPIAVFGWRAENTNLIQIPENLINDWTNTKAREKFILMLVDFVTKYRPPYVFLGNENDFYYESHIADYANWIIAYDAMYDAIKEVSETTLVGPVFNFEHISGRGALNGWNATFWEALEDHNMDKVDVVGLTVYPFFQYENPEDVPSNYLNVIKTKIGSKKPIVITETGWPAENLDGFTPQWVATEEAQQTYVKRLKKITSGGHSFPVVNWLYFNGLRDDGTSSDAWKTFGSISIKDRFGNEYKVYNDWLGL